MRVKLINAVTKTEMWVAEERLDAYLAAGNMLAAEKETAPAEKPTEEVPKAKKRTTTRKK